jgi:regulator of sirC expression with transglutaminase-like and TPR domain
MAANNYFVIACLGLVGCGALVARGQETPPAANSQPEPLPPLTKAEEAEVRRYVRELDSDDFAIRERASFRLRQFDERIVPFLEEALESRSLEVRMRAKALLSLLQVDPLAAFCALPDSQLSDEHGMFLIAQILNPNVKKADLARQLDDIAQQIRQKLAKQDSKRKPADMDPQVVVTALRQVFFDELKFTGNTEDYSNPDNSSLEKVLGTKKGLPITLSRIVVLVARRLDVPVVGIPASGRYIVKYDGSRAPVGFVKEDIYFHPFEAGKILSREDRRMLFPSHDPDLMVPPDSNREALTRMLRNLTSHLDHDPARNAQLTRANEMLQMLQPAKRVVP